MTGGSSSQSSRSAPWESQAPYLRQLFERANEQYGQGPYSNFGGPEVAGFSGESESAFARTMERSDQGAPLMDAAEGQIGATLRGDYLDPSTNPYLKKVGATAARGITDQYRGAVNALGSRMESSGRSGGGAHQRGLGRAEEGLATGLGDMYGRLYGGAYESERGRQAAAPGAAAGLSTARSDLDYRNLSAARSVGQQREAKSQEMIDSLVERFRFKQDAGNQSLRRFAELLGGPIMEQESQSDQINWGVGGGCWVAAEFFGWFTPAWFATRDWVMEQWQGEEAEAFRSFYLRHGPDLARAMRDNAALRGEWRPVFERFRELGEASA